MTTPGNKDTIVDRVRRAIEKDNYTGVALPGEKDVLVSDRQLGTTTVEIRRVVRFYENGEPQTEYINEGEERQIQELIEQRPR